MRYACSVSRFAVRFVLVLTAVAVLLAVVRGGTRFFYCTMTHLAFDESPCATNADAIADADANENADAPAVRISDCCQERWRATAPTASEPKLETPSVAAAGLLAVLPPPAVDASSIRASVPFALPRDVRAGPPPPTAQERRARLMVFHI
jgi:hypothetical protein